MMRRWATVPRWDIRVQPVLSSALRLGRPLLLALTISCAVTIDASAATRPKNTAPPAISGAAQTGRTLTATSGAWSGTLPISYTYEWQRCSSQAKSCKAIAGAVQQQYLLVAADVGKRLRVQVTARNTAGSASATSAATELVAEPPLAPSNTALPVVSGEARVGATLTASAGEWSGTEPIELAYRWELCSPVCADIAGATDPSYVVTQGDVGSRLRVRVTATNVAGIASATSAATELVGSRRWRRRTRR